MITNQFLINVAGYVNGRITKVILNGSYEIISFNLKEVAQGTIQMQYTVPNGAVSVITLIELKDNIDIVISSNPVYVPITTDTIITQTIQVKEG